MPRCAGGAWGCPEARIYSDYRALLDDPNVDAVEILLPHHLHAEAALAAMDAGKHVSLQKPMTILVADADRLIARAKATGVVFRVFENFIFYPPIAKAKALVDAGAIGEPKTIRIKSNPGRSATAWEVPVSADAWRQDITQNGGGPLAFDDGHHKFATAWNFMGLAEEVHAWIGTTEAGERHGLRRAGRSSRGSSPATATATWRSSIRRTSISSPSTMRRTTGSKSPARLASSPSIAATGASATSRR